MTSRTDQELWVDILAGNNKGWEELIRRYQSLVYAVCMRAGLSMPDVADCFQQTWVLLYKNRKSLKDPSRLSAWLVTTAKREAMRLRKLADKEPEDTEEMIWKAPGPLPDEELEKIECQVQLELALGAIDERCRKILHAFFFATEEKSYEDIARSFGIPANSLGPIRRRCLEKLKRALIDMGYIEERKIDEEPL
jgi:RNA polymerase sigma factor (sigma-70 family)